ncbi:MAG: Spy/CpxP family protein refolding chaperone [Gemmatimonadota bacterium]|nr:Spy/CpxP family protein refolding chaperone [Gemmatimonadota bacterium]
MKMKLLTVAAAALMAAPMLHAQSTTATATATRSHSEMGTRHGRHGMMMKDLNLTADQKAKVKAIHEKYATRFKATRANFKPDFDAMKAARARGDSAGMRAARAKLQADRGPSMQVHQQEMSEVRGILTPAQQTRFDAAQAKWKANEGKRDGAWKGKRRAKPAV